MGNFLAKEQQVQRPRRGASCVCSQSGRPVPPQQQTEPGEGRYLTGSAGQQGGTPQSLTPVVRTSFFHSEMEATSWLQAEEGHDLMLVLLVRG